MNLSSDSALKSSFKRLASPRVLYFLSVLLPLIALGFAFKFSTPPLTQPPTVQQPLPEPEQNSTEGGYTRLSVLSLFTQPPPRKLAVKRQDDSDEQQLGAPESSLPVKVTGLLSSDIDSHSIAIVQQNQQQVTLSIGDTLPATTATIVRILPQRVIIRHQGKFETLTMK